MKQDGAAKGMAIERLREEHLEGYRQLMRLFGQAFEDEETYGAKPPPDAYALRLLGKDELIFLAASKGSKTLGGLVAYALEKFERERTEIYIYDLAVAEEHRRRGIATALIRELRKIAANLGAHTVFVQADYCDPPAVSLYEKLGKREEVLHFDIEV